MGATTTTTPLSFLTVPVVSSIYLPSFISNYILCSNPFFRHFTTLCLNLRSLYLFSVTQTSPSPQNGKVSGLKSYLLYENFHDSILHPSPLLIPQEVTGLSKSQQTRVKTRPWGLTCAFSSARRVGRWSCYQVTLSG